MKTKKRFDALDSWRGICALMVALFHFSANSHINPLLVVQHAGLFVDFFFVLSGFVIFYGYFDKLEKGYGLFKFFILRFGRLYPLHVFTLGLFVSVELLQMFIPSLSGLSADAPFTARGETPDYIASNLLMLHSLGYGDKLSFNAPSWSISAELWTYVVFAVLIVTLKKKVIWGVTLIILLSGSYLAYHNNFLATLDFGVLRCFYGFGFGALGFFIWRQCHQHVENLKLTPALWTMLEALNVALVILFVSYGMGTTLMAITPLIFLSTVLTFSFEKGLLSKCLKGRFFLFVGALSYSIYMVHTFVSAKIFNIAGVLIEKFTDYTVFTIIDGNKHFGTNALQADILTLLYILSVIAMSWVTYKIIEIPFQKWSRNIVK